MSTYQITVGGQFNDGGYEYPLNLAVPITVGTDPLKRAYTVGTSQEIIFTRPNTNQCTAVLFNRGENPARVRVYETGGDTVDFLLPAGRFMAIPSADISVDASAGAFSAFTQWDNIAVASILDTTQVELLIIEEEPAS